MSEKRKEFLIRLEKYNYEYLKELNLKTKIPINKILNTIISNMDRNVLELLEYKNENTDKEVRFRITESERNFLENESKLNGNDSITNEIKFRILNTIYKNKFFTINEKNEFIKTRYELNSIGRNLNQLVKKIHKKEIGIDDNELKEVIKSINKKSIELSNELEKYIIHTNKRF